MELWAAGIALLIIAAGILVLILCGKKSIKACESPEYVYLAHYLRRCWDILPLPFCFWTHWILLPWMSLRFPGQCYLRNRLH